MNEHNKVKGNKSGRKFRTDSPTYKLFEELFLDLTEDKLPHILNNLSRGQAINLAMGLNRCHIQWAQENGIPSEYITRSAKAKDPTRPDGTWDLEISLNQKHTRAGSSWIKDLLGQKTGTSVEPEVDVMEELLRKGGYVD